MAFQWCLMSSGEQRRKPKSIYLTCQNDHSMIPRPWEASQLVFGRVWTCLVLLVSHYNIIEYYVIFIYLFDVILCYLMLFVGGVLPRLPVPTNSLRASMAGHSVRLLVPLSYPLPGCTRMEPDPVGLAHCVRWSYWVELRFSPHLASLRNGCDGLMVSLLPTAFEWIWVAWFTAERCWKLLTVWNWRDSRCETCENVLPNEFSQTAGGVCELLRERGQLLRDKQHYGMFQIIMYFYIYI